jgi:membrane protease YdiL (CAAX protease family)
MAKVNEKTHLVNIDIATGLLALTFAIPTVQWLATKLIARPEFVGVISSTAVIVCTGFWLTKTKAFHFRILSLQWKMFYYLALIVVLGLLIFNVQNQPVSQITGKARTPFEVLDLIVLLPIAEELIFRGAIWSAIQKFLKVEITPILVLTGTSLLFGIEHLGYWAQSNWPLPPGAYLHAFSMVFAGLFFGYFRLKSDSLAVPAVLHMLANGAILLTQ